MLADCVSENDLKLDPGCLTDAYAQRSRQQGLFSNTRTVSRDAAGWRQARVKTPAAPYGSASSKYSRLAVNYESLTKVVVGAPSEDLYNSIWKAGASVVGLRILLVIHS